MLDTHLLRFNKKQKYLIADCETCNLNLALDKNLPWQWAWQVSSLEEEKIEFKNIYINWPGLKVSKEAALLTGYDANTVSAKGISPQEALKILDSYLYDEQYIIVMHNGLNFDVYLHNIMRRVLGKKSDFSYLKRFIDSNAIARAWKYGVKLNGDRLSFQYKFANAKLKGIKTSIMSLSKEFDIPYNPQMAHKAEYDINLNWQIFKKLIFNYEI
ncbi:MAG: hypothetical protein HC836_24220 [Richelia sp. RM2_1_2]|nr:hypothetical protein [Richelia sp. RM2_1_2]